MRTTLVAVALAAAFTGGASVNEAQEREPEPATDSPKLSELLETARRETRVREMETAECLTTNSERDCFALWTGCAPVGLYVPGVDPNGAGLKHESLQNLAERRLRAARLYDSESGTRLSLMVNVSLRSAFGVRLGFVKPLSDRNLSLERSHWATTWEQSTVGMHGNDANFILGVASRYLDEFLVEYLRVNEDACGGPAANR